jgi:hypothetical protein
MPVYKHFRRISLAALLLPLLVLIACDVSKHNDLQRFMLIALTRPAPPPGWTCTSLHPQDTAGSTYAGSGANAIHNGKIGGWVAINDYGNSTNWAYHAAYWPTPSADSYVDLSKGKLQSTIFAMSDNIQAGYFVQFGAYWNTVPMDIPNFVKSDPFPGYSTIYGLSGNWASGAIQTQEESHARLWNLSLNTLVDLSPAGATNSGAWAIYGATDIDPGVQVGKADIGAALWSGTAVSYVNLHPDTLAVESDAWAVYGTHQGGMATMNSDGKQHAMLWSGTKDSAVDMHPATVAGVTRSFIHSMAEGIQVGFIELNDNDKQVHAFFWRGSATDYLDLHSMLPAKYSQSWAWAVEKTGNNIWIVGSANNEELDQQEAILWRYMAP